MTQGFQRFTKRYVNVLGVLIGLAVVSSILLYSGCGMTSSPKTPASPTPTPTPAPPTSTITSPTEGATVPVGTQVAITGTASSAGGGSVVRGDVSVDGGANYGMATGTTAWSFNWTPSSPGPVTIKSRAVDNLGNVQNPPAEIHVTVKDLTPPTSTITSPTAGAFVNTGITVHITGTASDAGGGSVVKVEVSVDGGASYSTATGTNAWSFNWTPTTVGQATIKSRAVDNS
jgi:Bacterial Ig domain